MERGREGRRGSGGGGIVARRPRTGFKDVAGGDDGDDMMDDAHNSRLRERSKKDGSGVTSSHGAATSIVGGSSRNKRKRPSSQEKVVHGRSSPAEEVEETTEDTEMGGSEDDDDHPPPIIPRRSGKSRPQAKFAEDGNAVDLPAVPRKARTAIGKRPHEASTPPVAESPGHTGGVGGGAAAPSSTVSSSSIASLKAEKRTKPSASKQRAHKLPKVTAPSLVSEQEVEVAEALFDLARMFSQPAAAVVESKTEIKVIHNDLKFEAKLDRKVSAGSGSSLPPQPSNSAAVASSVWNAAPASGAAVVGTVKGTSPVSASAASPIPSPPVAASSAEVVKRKRPRVRARTEEGSVPQSKTGPNTTSTVANPSGTGAAQVKDADQSSNKVSVVDRIVSKVESSTTVTPAVFASPTNVAISSSSTHSIAVVPSGVAAAGPTATATEGGAVGGAFPRADKSIVEKKVSQLEKKTSPGGGKADVANSNSQEEKATSSPVQEKKILVSESAGHGTIAKVELDPILSTSIAVEEVITKMEPEKRPSLPPADVDRAPKREIDLMVAPTNLEDASSPEKDGDSEECDVRDATEKPAVDLVITPGVRDALADREQEREVSERAERDKVKEQEKEKEKEKQRQQELERDRDENERRREADNQRELAKDTSKEREIDKERERSEISKVGVQRSSKVMKGENGRTSRTERAGSAVATTASQLLVPVPPVPTTCPSGLGAHVAALPMSMGMLGWPAGMPGSIPASLGYYPTAAAAAAAAAALSEESSPAIQLPYIVPPRPQLKRCALHVYIAHFIDVQQQLNRHQTFFSVPNQGYPKSYNLNVPLGPSDGVFGGSPMMGAAGGAVASGSAGGGAKMEATDRGLNAAAMAAATAASVQGAKERGYNLEMVGRKSPGRQQHGGQQAAALSLQSGLMLGFPVTQSASPSGVGGGGGRGLAGAGTVGSANVNMVGGGTLCGTSAMAGSRSPVILGPGAVGGVASAGSSGGVTSAVVQAQYMQAIMQQQPQGYPFGQFPGHFGPAAFNGPASHMGAQQAAAQLFAASGTYFPHHMVPHAAQQGGQGSGSAGNGGGGGGVGQGQQQGRGRGFPGAGSGAHGPRSQSPLHLQQQGGGHGGAKGVERESLAAGENGSSRVRGSGMYAVTSASAGSGSPGVNGAGEYNLMVGLGKVSKAREAQQQGVQGQDAVSGQGGGSEVLEQGHQQLGGAGDAGGIGAGGGKGAEGGSSGGYRMSMAVAMNRGASVGPGPLGLAPVSAVMAPQGHAMIQGVAEGGSGHQQQTGGGSGHASMLQQQQQQRHHHHLFQNGRIAAVVGEDNSGARDLSFSSSIGRGREREVIDDMKRCSGAGSPSPRVVGGCEGTQASAVGSRGGLGSSRNQCGPTLNLTASTDGGVACRSSMQSCALGVAVPVQQQAIGVSKHGGAKPKGTGGSNLANPAALHFATEASFSDRLALTSGSLAGKGPTSQELSLAGQTLLTSQVGRQGQVGQHPQTKKSQRVSHGALSGTTAATTASMTNFQAALAAAAMAKNSLVQQTQRPAPLGLSAATNACVSATAGSSPRMGLVMAGSPLSPGTISLASMAPPCKSPGLNPSKSSSSQKSSFPVSQKVGGGGGKQDSSPLASKPAQSTFGSSVLALNISSKSSQQPLVQIQGQGQGPQQHVGVQSQVAAQGHGPGPPSQQQQHHFHQQQQHKQMMIQQQQQMIHQHVFQQQHEHQHLQQQQQSAPPHSSQGGPQHLQAVSHQQQVGHQQQPGLGSEAQQVSSQQLQHVQPQQASQLQHHQQAASHSRQQLSGPAGNDSLVFSVLSLGAGSNFSAGVGGRSSSNSDAGGGVPNGRLVQCSKQALGGSIPVTNVGCHRARCGPGGASPFLQQYGSGGVVSSGPQQLASPRSSAPIGYSEGNSTSGAAGRADSCREQVNGLRMKQGEMQARPASTIATSGGMHGSSQRPQSGGGGASKEGVGQVKSFGDIGQSQSSVMMPSSNATPQSGGVTSNGQISSSSPNVQSGDGRPALNGGSSQQVSAGQSQVHTSASMAGGGIETIAPVAALGPQPPTSVVQQ